jgi:protein subunit release factor B
MIMTAQRKFDTDLDILQRQVIIETYRSRGPGGQRKNKVETAVRLTHLPSGIKVAATEQRSQSDNRRVAFERLRERLIKLNRPKKRRIASSLPLAAVEKRMEEKKIRSEKKRFRRKSQKELADWN